MHRFTTRKDALIAVGAGQIAARLDMAETATKTHVSRILGKLGLAGRVQAAVLAQETAPAGLSATDPHKGSSGAG